MQEDDIITLFAGKRGQLATFTPSVINRIALMLPAQSKETVADILGISSNTWLKIKCGEPIRASTAYSLANRLSLIPKGRLGISPQ